LDANNFRGKIWLTETGFSTWQFDEVKQAKEFVEVLKIENVERVYWYSLFDLELEKATVDGFHIDDREYYFGLKTFNGTPKLLFRLWKNQGIDSIKSSLDLLTGNIKVKREIKPALITGGAGFVGTNFADSLLSEGKPVIIYDNLSREGVERNLAWLKDKHRDLVEVRIADIRNSHEIKKAVKASSEVYHFAAQVAVTTSVTNPVDDFDINIRGTLNVLEAIRNLENPVPLIFTSTNKVYGDLNDIELDVNSTRYYPVEESYREGINEDRPLSFHSPYGCSKGAADQYVLDYARIYNLPAAVFRMSCIYGPHQYGNEDQGWVAHCLLSAMEDKTITIYGDGKQVRDILFVNDLVDALKLARKNINKLSAHAYNVGGSNENSVSLLEVMDLIEKVLGRKVDYQFSDWRPGDQRFYISDTSNFRKMTGWNQKINYKQGLEVLYNWIIDSRELEMKKELMEEKA
jgi:CDP-paratose 2-epimerase